MKRHLQDPLRFSPHELNDNTCRAYALPGKERVVVLRRIAKHLVELRNRQPIDAIAAIDQEHPV